ncbi:uncharacterized protein LAJ45_09725 [Morchella importuna]|uniref:uncharacterized protein n=1 Tax=Morchella importuna TaxID=1174673 RepID=UPI001E8DED94|nr:uncharacterized protein LAJ45_09725 [Morchella importuna]KAH8146283.1 hypothetical protein LAJ45_09725 [Morchella importuna]
MAVSANSVSLSAPYIIFPLSQPLHQTRAKDREGGTYRVCFTSSVESTKKRKRNAQEIAVAVDGEGVNIYDVRATQVISTYALPPTTKFSCAPTSSFTRGGKKATAFGRRTYAAVSSPKREILCWEEQSVSSDDDKAEAINVLSRGSDSRSDVVYLQDLRKRGTEGGLVAVYADGYVRCFSSDLKEQKWEFLAQTLGAAKKVAVVFAATTTLTVAKKALLKDRLDIVLPTAVPTEEEAPEDAVLFTVTRNGSIFEARVFTIPTIGENKTPRELLVLPLPGTADEELASFSIHFPTATLDLLTTENLTTFSLSATVPAVLSSLKIASNSKDDPTPSSLLRISSSTVLVATNEDISLYDTKFTSLQARVPIQPSTGVNTPATSRASTPASTVKGGVALSSYLPDLDLAVGYSQNGIAAVQLSRAGVKGDARKSGLLIDSLCRGVGVDAPADVNKAGRTAAAKQIASKLSAEKTKMDAALARLKDAKKDLDLEAFESTFAEYVSIKRNMQDVDTTMTNGTSANNALPEFFAKTTFKPLLHEFVSTIISLIFEPSGNEVGGLKITFYPPNVVKYLAESGNLSSAPPGLVNALATYDPTLRSLEWALSTVSELKITEVAAAVSTALRAPEAEEDLALKVIRSEVLRLALVRLDTFPASSLIATFKSQFTGDDLAALITLLRGELSLYDYEHDDDFDAPEVAVSISDVGIASSLLTAALDTVGISGLILQDGADSLVGSLYEEVTDAVDAVEEAAGLKGILEEMFRHAEWSSPSTLKRRVEIRGTAPTAPPNAPASIMETPKREGGKVPETPSMQLLRSAMKARGNVSVRKGASPGLLRTVLETPRPSERTGSSALLPLGLSPVPLGRENKVEGLPLEVGKRETDRKRARENGMRKSLVLGVYSVESMVI